MLPPGESKIIFFHKAEATAFFGWGLDPKNLPILDGSGTTSDTMCPWTTQVYLPNGT